MVTSKIRCEAFRMVITLVAVPNVGRKFAKSTDIVDPNPPLPLTAGTRLAVGGHVIDMAREALLDAQGATVELRPQAYQVLRHLALNAGRVVTKDELMAAVWPHTVVTDDSLVQAVGDVRRALGDARHEVLKTVPRRGYLLVATALPGAAPPLPIPQGRRSSIQRPAVAAAACIAALAAGLLAWHAGWGGGSTGAAAPVERPSVAVLAFKAPQSGADGEALARGFAEDLGAELARGPELRVVSHHSSFAFAASTTPLAEVGARLRSRYLVEGSVEREDEKLHVSVRLVDSGDGRVLWSFVHDVDRASVPAVRRALASRIAGTLLSRVQRTEAERALARPPKSFDAVVLTEHGKAQLLRYDADGMRRARSFFDRALALDAEFAPAWAWLGMANTVDAGLRLTGEWTLARLPEIESQVRKAIALDPELAMGWVALAQVKAFARDYDAALAAAQRCFDVSPNGADCFYVMGKAQLETGDAPRGARTLQEAMDRNPLPPSAYSAFYATALWGSGRLSESVHVADECLTRAPEFWRCRQDRIAALVELGRLDEARLEAQRLMARVPKMTTERFTLYSPAATALSERRMAAARAAGIPEGAQR
jgi:TolB-like protein/DNA-binding winged helix-turn-helix (wHTH) protein